MVQEDWVSFKDRVKKFYSYSIEETRSFWLVSIVFGLLYGFTSWWVDGQVVVTNGIIYSILYIVIFSVSLAFRQTLQRLQALRLGYKPDYRFWPNGLIGAAVLAIFFRGNFWLIFPFVGCMDLHMMIKHRLGKFRYGINMVSMGMVSLIGIWSHLLLAYIIKIINSQAQLPILNKMVLINLMLAVVSILPIPPISDGSRVFYWSRIAYVFNTTMIITMAILIYFTNNLFFILFGAVVIAAIVWFVYYVSFEEDSFES